MRSASHITGRRRLALVAPAGLAALALILGACGGDEDGDATSTATATATVSPTETATSTVTASPTETASPTGTPDDGDDGEAPGEPTIEDAVDTLEAYFAAIGAGDYQAAYDFWDDDGAASGQTFEEFAAGFEDTETIAVEIGEPGEIEAAAGSRYVDIPVVISSTLASGEEQEFQGTYVFRRGVVEGAEPEWRIYSAEVEEVQ